MYCVLLLLTLFTAVVFSQTPSQACLNTQEALFANRPCLNAIIQVGESISNNATLPMGDLNTFCSSTCRNLNNQVTIDCDDEVSKQFYVYNRA